MDYVCCLGFLKLLQYEINDRHLSEYSLPVFICEVVYILTSVWVQHTPDARRNMIFFVFCAEKMKKGRKSKKFDSKFSNKIGF